METRAEFDAAFGRRVATLRHHLGHDEKAFAALVDVSIYKLRRIESGARIYQGASTLVAIGEATGASLDWLVFGHAGPEKRVSAAPVRPDGTSIPPVLRAVGGQP